MQAGDLIAGRFRLEASVGAGGMGVVYRARDERAGLGQGQLVAIKALHKDSPSSVERFLREAAALAELAHPVVVGHIAHGLSEANEPYLALEWIQGPTLANRLASRGVTPLEALQLAQRVLEGLCALHAHGIVHRDLKPSNLMLPNDVVADVRILDLGIARFADASVELTVEGSQLGTPRYMAPEQIRDPRSVDGRADVFALGCVLFECLSGFPAFPGDDPVAVLAQILFGHAAELGEVCPDLPEELEQLLNRLLARSPERRPAADPALLAEFAQLTAAPFAVRLHALPTRCSVPPPAPFDATIASNTQLDDSRVRPSVPPLLGAALHKRRDTSNRRLSWPQVRRERAGRPFVARERELQQLLRWLEVPQPITLWGGAGIGKTRLALELAQRAVADGIVSEPAVLWCDLSAARDSRDVVRICSEQLGVTNVGQADAEDQAGRLFAKLGALLIILDRAEQLTRELEPLIAWWHSYAPELRVVVTSRVRLRSTRELALGPLAHAADAWPVRPITLRPALTATAWQDTQLVQPSQPSAAAQLVLALAREAGQGVDAPAIAQQAEAIAAALEGNPLAIELALARLPLLGFPGIVERLSAQLTLLGEHSSSQTMRQALEWSWQLLRPVERAVCLQCSVFAAAFTVQAAEAVIRLPDSDASVIDVIEALREQSLLSARAEADGQALLSLPAVVREFAREQQGQPEHSAMSSANVKARHADYAAHTQANTLAFEDRVAAAEFSLSPEGLAVPRALSLLLGLERQLLAAGVGSLLANLLERALAYPADSASRALTLQRLAAHQLRARLWAPSDAARAQADLDHVLAVATQLNEPHLLATALLDLGVVRHFASDLTQASAYYERALEVLDTVDDAVAEARCHGNLGAVHHDRADLFAAAVGYRRALALLPERGQERLVANFQGNLALVEHELGDKQTARRLYGEAAARLETLLDMRLLGIVLGNFGSLALAEGQHDEALQHFVRAAALLEHSGDRRSEGLSLARLAAGLAVAGHVPEAEQRHAHAERLLRKDPVGRAVVELVSGFIDSANAERARAQGQGAAARRYLASAAQKCTRSATLRERSDDLRLYLALLEPEIARLTALTQA